MHGFHLGLPESHYLNAWSFPFHSQKRISGFSGVPESFQFCLHHVAISSQWKVAFMTSSIITTSSRWQIHRYNWQKITPYFCNQFTHFVVRFFKSHSHVLEMILFFIIIWNLMKIGETQHHTVLTCFIQHAVCMIKRALCVWCLASKFCTILPGVSITGNFKIKFLSKVKCFPNWPTRCSGPYVTGTKQLFLSSLSRARNSARIRESILAMILVASRYENQFLHWNV